MGKKIIITLFLSLVCPYIYGTQKKSILWEDIKSSLDHLAKASYKQFQTPNSWWSVGLGAGILGLSFERDNYVLQKWKNSEKKTSFSIISTLGVISTFPLLPGLFYYQGHRVKNKHLIQFSKELFAATYLALIESGLLSYIRIHNRPDSSNLSFWETKFRGPSSFPSGHVIPFATLFFKTLQFYGPIQSIAPGILTALVGYERIRDEKHYLSDVVGGIFLAALASQGVSRASQYKGSNGLVRFIKKHKIRPYILSYSDIPGLFLTWPI